MNYTDGKLLVLLCITTDKKNDNHEYESIININFNTQHVSDFNDKNIISLSRDPLNCFESHDFDTYKDGEDGEMNVNLPDDSQVLQIDLMEVLIGEYETHVEGSTNEPFLVGDDHLEQYQIYSDRKELWNKLCMIALKIKFQFKTVTSSIK